MSATVHLGYNDTSFHATDIVTNRVSVHQDGASMFHAKDTCQERFCKVNFSLISLRLARFHVKYTTSYVKYTWAITMPCKISGKP